MQDPLAGREFLTSAGIETWLIFEQGVELREFCAFEIFDDETAFEAAEQRFLFPILDIAERCGRGAVLDALVWRAQPDYLAQLGYPATELASLNRRAVERTRLSVERWRDRSSKSAGTPVLVSADLGPRGDGYQVADSEVTPERAHDYHAGHVAALAEAGVDLACALTMTSVNESIGLARAVAQHDLPLVVSPTVETDGRLPDRTSLGEFIERVDDATSGSPLFYMVNCAHPTHLEETLERAAEAGEAWLDRFRGLRANASTRSHAELDEATELDRGDPADLGRRVARLRDRFGLTLLGGCCGTDPEHIEKIAEATTRP